MPLFPYTEKFNARVIALNRRHYGGTTLLNDEELHTANSTDDCAHQSFLARRGLEIAQFLVWLIEKNDIPMRSADGKTGGIALLGWSMGVTTVLSFFANLKSYPCEIVTKLEPYLKSLILHGMYSDLTARKHFDRPDNPRN